jgi:hypothetical protein
MVTLAEIRKKLGEVFDERQATVLAEVFVDAYGELVKTSDFNELKAIVKELAEAQARTEQRVGELAEVQARTEQRMEELVAAQKEGATRMTRLEGVVEELAEAQTRTERALQKLAQEHVETRRQLGGISMTVGYTLKNEAFKALPALLQRDFGVIVRGRPRRKYVTDNKGKSIEVNIIGEATKEGKEVVIVGESKSQLSKNDVDHFVRRKLNRLAGVYRELFPVLITHMTTAPDVGEYVKEKGIALYYSYDF